MRKLIDTGKNTDEDIGGVILIANWDEDNDLFWYRADWKCFSVNGPNFHGRPSEEEKYFLRQKSVDALNNLIEKEISEIYSLLFPAELCALTNAGLKWDLICNNPVNILGGVSIVSGDILGFNKAFSIFEEGPGKFFVGVSEFDGHPEEEMVVSSLEAAVQNVVSIYRNRG